MKKIVGSDVRGVKRVLNEKGKSVEQGKMIVRDRSE